MAKQLDIGVSNVARKGKKAWVGVSSKARKIKKMWIGDANGKARLFFSGGELVYKGATSSALYDTSHVGVRATTVGNYAIFAGGSSGGTNAPSEQIRAYDSALTQHTPSPLTQGRYGHGAATVGNYAIFCGGEYNESGSSYSAGTLNTSEGYNSSLTKVSVPAMQWGIKGVCGASVGNYALFNGSSVGINMFDSSLTYTQHSQYMSDYHRYGAATEIANYALFAGGDGRSGVHAGVDVVNSSLTVSTASNLSVARAYIAAATVGNYALFAGGRDTLSGTSRSAVVDTYDKSLTKGVATSLSVARSHITGTSVGDYAIFAGGQNSSWDPVNTVDIYDASLTRTTSTLGTVKSDAGSATVGDYALIGGGDSDTGSNAASVYVYQVD